MMIFWDFGGVIVQDNVHPAFEQYGIPWVGTVQEAWKQLRLGKITQPEFYDLCFQDDHHPPHLRPAIEQRVEELLELHPDSALPVIQNLSRYRHGAISNHSREWGRAIVQRWSLDQYFDPIIISAEVGLDKTSPDIFHLALQRADVKAEDALFVDNSSYCVEMAGSVGMKGILYQGREKLVEEFRRYGLM